jgi:hypothetical protein
MVCIITFTASEGADSNQQTASSKTNTQRTAPPSSEYIIDNKKDKHKFHNAGCTDCRAAAAPLPCHCRVDSLDPHGFPKDLLIKMIAFVYVICKNSANAINLCKKK